MNKNLFNKTKNIGIERNKQSEKKKACTPYYENKSKFCFYLFSLKKKKRKINGKGIYVSMDRYFLLYK